MNEFLKKIGSSFKNLNKGGVSYKKKYIKPARDWRIILSVGIILIIISASIASYFYFEIEGGRLFSSENVSKDVEIKINLDLLKKITDDFNAREERWKKIGDGLDVPPDPSL